MVSSKRQKIGEPENYSWVASPAESSLEAVFLDLSDLPVAHPDDNAFHALIRSGASLREFVQRCVELGITAAAELATTVNDDGHLPLDLLEDSLLPPEEKASISILLTALCKKNNLPSLKQAVTIEAVLAEYPAPHLSALHLHLMASCVAANFARLALHESTTHPQLNDFPFSFKQSLIDKLNKMRSDSKKQVDEIKSHPEECPPVELRLKILSAESETSYAAGVGNCYEYSKVAMYYLAQHCPLICVEAMSLGYGDHVFLVLGRDPRSAISDYRNWGPDAVVCDPWSGKVYPASTIEKNLKNFRQIKLANNDFINVLTSFNPNYHYIRSEFFIHEPLPPIFQAPMSSSAMALPLVGVPGVDNSVTPQPSLLQLHRVSSFRDLSSLVPEDEEQKLELNASAPLWEEGGILSPFPQIDFLREEGEGVEEEFQSLDPDGVRRFPRLTPLSSNMQSFWNMSPRSPMEEDEAVKKESYSCFSLSVRN